MPRGILFIAGCGPTADVLMKILDDDDVICAADSGLDVALAAGIFPMAVVGDMDSVSDRGLLDKFPQELIEVYPEDKNDTDTEIGIAWLRRRGCNPIVIVGGGEGRLDHTLALVKIFESSNAPDLWFTAREVVSVVCSSLVINGDKDETVSFYPVGCGPWDVRSRGLRWELDGVKWADRAMSLSNRLRSTKAEIDVKSGRLLLIRSLRNC